mgnify:CR=1 FL=1
MIIYVDATTLIALGEVGELDLLALLDGDLTIPVPVADEISAEPARSDLLRFDTRHNIDPTGIWDERYREAKEAREESQRILDEDGMSGDVAILAGVVNLGNEGMDSAVVSDDRRLRTVAESLGARVTGTIGVVVGAVAEGELTEQEAKDLVRRLDSRGLHMTGELREKADRLIEDAARENGNEN